MKPVIGVCPLFDYERDSYWMLPGYFDGVIEAGGLPVMLPLTSEAADCEQLLDKIDALLVTGGQDVNPVLYGEDSPEAAARCLNASAGRDAMEAALIPMALARDLPLLGICRGLQVLNAVCGGTLYQDLPTQLPSEVNHHQPSEHPERPIHSVEFAPDSPLAKLLRVDTLQVNSFHHQGVHQVAPEFEPMATAPDGLVEAIWSPTHAMVWGVQWHPEFMHKADESSKAIFKAFVKAAQGRRTTL